MTQTDIDTNSYPGLRKALVSIIGGLTLLFLTGFVAGFTVATFEHGGPTLKEAAIIALMLAMIAAVVLAGWRLWPKGEDEPISQRTRKARNWMYVIVAFSIALGFGFAMIEGPGDNPLFSNAPLDPVIAILALVAWLIITPALSWAWWRNVDEHEASAYRESSTVAVHFYLFLVPAWWFASRAGWIPEQDPMIVFLLVTAAWSVVWLYRKYF